MIISVFDGVILSFLLFFVFSLSVSHTWCQMSSQNQQVFQSFLGSPGCGHQRALSLSKQSGDQECISFRKGIVIQTSRALNFVCNTCSLFDSFDLIDCGTNLPSDHWFTLCCVVKLNHKESASGWRSQEYLSWECLKIYRGVWHI